MKNFTEQEFIPRTIWDYFQAKYHDGRLAMRYINPKIPMCMDYLREYLGTPIIINDYMDGGGYDERCLRAKHAKSYREFSDHTFGNAVDFHVPAIDVTEIYDIITMKIPETIKAAGVTAVEDIRVTPTWIHLGFSNLTAWSGSGEINGIKILRP